MAANREQFVQQAASGGKYAPLYRRLSARTRSHGRVSFAEIEAILGFELPASARLYRPWWSNQKRGAGHRTTPGKAVELWIFFATNVLARARFETVPSHGLARRRMREADESGEALRISRQALQEYPATVTPPQPRSPWMRPSITWRYWTHVSRFWRTGGSRGHADGLVPQGAGGGEAGPRRQYRGDHAGAW